MPSPRYRLAILPPALLAILVLPGPVTPGLLLLIAAGVIDTLEDAMGWRAHWDLIRALLLAVALAWLAGVAMDWCGLMGRWR